MRLLIVTHYYPGHCGGIEIVAEKLAEHLTAAGEIKIEWMGSDRYVAPRDIPGLECTPLKSFHFIEQWFSLPYPIPRLSSLKKIWDSVKREDIIHLHDYLYAGNLVAFLFAKISKKPVLVTQHIGWIPYRNMLARLILFCINRTLGKGVLGAADQIVFCSEVVQKYFCSNRHFRRPPVMIPNGLDQNLFFPLNEAERRSLRQRSGFEEKKPLFIFAGRFVEKKGLTILQFLASEFFSVQWVFAGEGPLNPEKWHLPNVTVLTRQGRQEMARLYQVSDLLVLPSYGEGFPLVVQESMACGTPALIGSETASAYSPAGPLLLSENVLGKDIFHKWKLRIQGILDHPSILSNLRPRVADFAREHWDWKKCAASYGRLYRELTDGDFVEYANPD